MTIEIKPIFGTKENVPFDNKGRVIIPEAMIRGTHYVLVAQSNTQPPH